MSNAGYRKHTSITLEQRFWANVGDRSGCWQWTGPLMSNGYGRIHHERKARLAHRTAYELFIGPIPDGLTIDHLCSKRDCVNPQHMEPVTAAENARRGEKNRRTRSGGGWMADRAECKNGHPYVEGSYRMAGNARVCLACARANQERFHARKKRTHD